MTASWLTVDKCIRSFSNFTEETLKPPPKEQINCNQGMVRYYLLKKIHFERGVRVFLCSGTTLIPSFSSHCGLIPLTAKAKENALKDQEADECYLKFNGSYSDM
ncbi:hypothetical protein IFM89_028461 [Coptis chinensis]|uniref:Uncharacterized protein n=1 Tax=Coptis chinensis TaxID=261450 RepID=A0A835IRX0_9MAGN|nr:hypothetical protein IFM89_028461 [Coptis chinensis]